MNAAIESFPSCPAADNALAALAERFPADFIWGAATSAFQIEGAASEGGRGDSIWDVFCRQPGAILDGSNGNIACDHYHRLDDDLDLLASLGLRAYRFSIAWPRVQPTGSGPWNEEGMAFYDRLISGLLARGIAPHITLYHWDLPQPLQDAGGWAARATVECFVDYAREIGRRFGRRVASIATHNEPWVVAILGHEAGIFAPGVRSRRTAFQVAHHLLLSHGLALRALRGDGVGCPLGIVLNQSPSDPATSAPADVARARLEDGLLVRWYMDPLFKGSYPEDVWTHLGEDVPEVLPGDLAAIHVPLDFLGLNYYTRNVVDANGLVDAAKCGTDHTAMGWEIRPASLRELLLRLHRDYVLPPFYIMENGAAFDDEIVDGEVPDERRVRYLETHLAAVADAVDAGVPVRGYFVWSLLDNFEWAQGYTKRFGIVFVDYATQRRLPKHSAHWYARLVQAHRDAVMAARGR
jgi:beta-glucosidase